MDEMPRNSKNNRAPALANDVEASCGDCLLLQLKSACCGDMFIDDACYQHFLTGMLQSQRPYHIELHAYSLLPESVLILMTPSRSHMVGKWLRHCMDSYTDYFQRRFRRLSLPFSASIGASRVTGKELILSAYCFVESAPLRARLAPNAASYRWTSHCANAFGGQVMHLTRHSALSRHFAHSTTPHGDYRDYVSAGLAPEFLGYIERRLSAALPLAKVSTPIQRVRVSRRVHQRPGRVAGRVHEIAGTCRYAKDKAPDENL